MIEKSVLEELYISGNLSMTEIAKKLNVSNHKVVWWMEKHEISRRSLSDATYVKRNPDGDPFKIKSDLSIEEQFLLGLGLGLYWGEGNKASKLAVRLGNSDPYVIRAFVKFLLTICRVKSEKIRFWLQIFADIDKEEALHYWQTMIGFPQSHFLPTVVVSPPQGKGTYKNKCKYGVLTVHVCNKKLRDWIMEQIHDLYEKV